MPKLLRNLLAVVAGIGHRQRRQHGVDPCGSLDHRAPCRIPAPAWFVALDLCAAYLPMAWVGTRIGARVVR